MDAIQELEAQIKKRGVRVEERLQILRLLQRVNGLDELNEKINQQVKAIHDAAAKCQEVIR